MANFEYKVLEVKVRSFPATAAPPELGIRMDEAAADGWQLDHCVPVMAKGFIGGSYTDSILLFLRRARP